MWVFNQYTFFYYYLQIIIIAVYVKSVLYLYLFPTAYLEKKLMNLFC